MHPYKEKKENIHIQRIFDSNVLESELIWHKDKKDRIIEVLTGIGWQLQLDNELPQCLIPGKIYYIPKDVFHRILKGQDNLTINIYE